MANLIIKPADGGSLILQDEGGTAAMTVAANGDATLAGTTNLSAGAILPSKHVKGVVSTTFQGVTSTTSTSFVDVSAYTAAITPSLAANKVLVFFNFTMNNEGGNYFYRMRRSGGASGDGSVYVGNVGSSIPASGGGKTPFGGAGSQDHTCIFLDSPGVASAVTYSLQYRNLDRNGTTRFNVNNDGTTNSSAKPTCASSITLMEIVT